MEAVLFAHLRDSPGHESQVFHHFLLGAFVAARDFSLAEGLDQTPREIDYQTKGCCLAQECLWVSKTTMQSLHGRHKM